MSLDLSLVLVRHGETEWTERRLLHGRLDSPLSEAGRMHARQAAQRLRGERFDAFYASPLGRAMQTAQILAEAVGLAPQPLEGLREVNYGWLEGRPMLHFDPAGLGTRALRPLVPLLIGLTGETVGQVAKRVARDLAEVVERHPTGRVLVVTHWGTLSMLMALLVDKDRRVWRRHGPWTACGISELRSTADASANGRVWHIVRMNETTHLGPEGRS